MPHNLPAETLSAHLKSCQADALIAEAGSLDLTLVADGNKQLDVVVWVAKEGNRHMDWHEVPDEVKGKLRAVVWHELVEEHKDLSGLDVPEYDPTTPAPAVNTVWPSSSTSGDFIDFKSEVGAHHASCYCVESHKYCSRTLSLLSHLWGLHCLVVNASLRPTWFYPSILSLALTHSFK